MHNTILVRSYEHTFPAVIWCVMRILILHLVWYKNIAIYLVSARQQFFFGVLQKPKKTI